MTEKPLETIGDVNAALKHLGWETVDDLHCWAISNDIERFEQLVQAFATHRTEAVAAHRAEIVAWLRESPEDWPWTGNDIANMIESGMRPWRE